MQAFGMQSLLNLCSLYQPAIEITDRILLHWLKTTVCVMIGYLENVTIVILVVRLDKREYLVQRDLEQMEQCLSTYTIQIDLLHKRNEFRV